MPKLPVWMWAAIIGLLGLLTLMVVNLVAVLQKPSDEEQIRIALEEMRQASLEGRAGSVLQYISDSIELPALSPEQELYASSAKSQIARFLRQAKITRLEFKDVSIRVEGSTAFVECAIEADLSYPALGELSPRFPRVVMEFRREEGKRLLVIPDPVWRVVRFQPIQLSDIRGLPWIGG
ncbi:MAG: hypothetical protein KatS3mg015_1494 [Fimbriimonadales bacterium]|nr:MAG: hypothetical protein KatS3mg015_1494 [Fimbriimonadales bacterium]